MAAAMLWMYDERNYEEGSDVDVETWNANKYLSISESLLSLYTGKGKSHQHQRIIP